MKYQQTHIHTQAYYDSNASFVCLCSEDNKPRFRRLSTAYSVCCAEQIPRRNNFKGYMCHFHPTAARAGLEGE